MKTGKCSYFGLMFVVSVFMAVFQVTGEENRKGTVNLVPNPSFEQPIKDKEGQAEGWNSYQCGYTRSKEKSCAPDVLGPWSCKISGSGNEGDIGLGGANTSIRSGLPDHGTFTATNSIYITSGTKGKIYRAYITVYYTDKTSEQISEALTPEQISANLDKWRTYSHTFSTKSDKKIDYIVYWCLVWSTNDGKFTGTVYFDELELKLVDEKAGVQASRPFVLVNKVNTPPAIDGLLNDKCWQEGLELAPFLLIGGNSLASQQTKACLTYDQNNIYIFMDCLESVLNPALQKTFEFKAEKSEHDSDVFSDDCVEIFIRPPGKEAYYHLAVNSKGTIYDEKRLPNSVPDKSWDSHASVKTLLTGNKWSAEISIPLQSLEAPVPGTGEVWGINLCREEKAFGENSSWSPVKSGFHESDSFGEVVFRDNILGATLSSIGNLQKGVNSLQLSFFNGGGKEAVVTLKTVVGTTGSPSIEKAFSRIEPGKKKTVKIPYTVGEDSKNMSYQFWQGDNLLYSSPFFLIRNQTLFMVKTQMNGSNYIKPLSDFYLAEGELLYLPLVLPFNVEKENVREFQVILEVPYFLRLINPLKREKSSNAPASVIEEELIRDDVKCRQYKLYFRPDSLTSPEAAAKNDFTVNPLLFKSEIIGTKARLSSYKINYQVFFNNQERISGNSGLTLLPPFTQKRPASAVICNWPCGATYYNQGFNLLGKEEQNEIVDSWIRSGFNILDSRLENMVDDKAVMLKGGIPGSLEDLCKNIADIGKYLSKHPEELTVTREGQILKGVISPAYLLKPGSPVGDIIKKHVGKMAQKTANLSFDYEVPVALPKSIGFDSANLELFRKFAGISQDKILTPETALTSYRQQWIDFRCRQNAELIGLLNEGIKKANPKSRFHIYSGYQSSYCQETYGINWQYASPYIDEVWCGYGRPLDQVQNTLKVIGGKPLVGGEIVWLGDGGIYNLDETEINLFHRMSDCGGGIMVYYDWCVDGRFFRAVSRVASVAADFENFFKNYNRDDSLVEVIEGEKNSVAVLKDGLERLLFIFNDNNSPKTFKMKNTNLQPNLVGIDYWEKKVVNLSPFLETVVLPHSVKIIYLQNQSKPVSPNPPRIVGGADIKVKGAIPFLVWDSNNSSSAVFDIEYSPDPSFPDSNTKKITGLADNYCRIEDPVIENTPYYWRVRTVDLVTNKKSAFSANGNFMIETLLNAGIQTSVFSPNGDGNSDTVIFQAELRDEKKWELEILDKSDKSVRTYSGKGKTVSLVWDGKNNRNELASDGLYIMRLKVGGKILIDKEAELNMKYGAPNMEIEKWCFWSSSTSKGASADRDYHNAYEKYSYSLLLKGEFEESYAYWSNYRTGTEIPITAGKQYTYSAFLKTDLKNGEAKIGLHFFTKDDRWAPIPGFTSEFEGVEAKLTGNNDWKKVSVTIQAPVDAAKAVLFFSLKGAGTCWLGALDFREIKYEK